MAFSTAHRISHFKFKFNSVPLTTRTVQYTIELAVTPLPYRKVGGTLELSDLNIRSDYQVFTFHIIVLKVCCSSILPNPKTYLVAIPLRHRHLFCLWALPFIACRVSEVDLSSDFKNTSKSLRPRSEILFFQISLECHYLYRTNIGPLPQESFR